MHGRVALWIGAVALVALSGCAEDAPVADPGRSTVPAARARFAGADTGTIAGQVVWDGPAPDVPPVVAISPPEANLSAAGKLLAREPNPFAPRIDSVTPGIEGAVVFLRGIDPSRAKPWDLGTVRVEIVKRQIRVVQGGQPARLEDSPRGVGFVRCGEAIEAVNRDPKYHSLRARGAAFFNLPLVDADKPVRRTLDKPGLVALSSGAGYPWMHAHLFVADHPYYTQTDKQGRFQLEQVPTGTYEAVCWMPSWKIERRDRDPETFMLARIAFAPPVERIATVVVRRADTVDVRFAWNAEGVGR